jgi:hypothetical protein
LLRYELKIQTEMVSNDGKINQFSGNDGGGWKCLSEINWSQKEVNRFQAKEFAEKAIKL